MTCVEFEEWLQSEADRRVRPVDDVRFADHARSCAACRALAEGFRLLAQGFTVSRTPVAPRDLAARTSAILIAESQPSSAPRISGSIAQRARRPRRAVSVLLAAAAALVAIIGVPWYFSGRAPVPDVPIATAPRTDIHVPAAEPDELLFPELAAADGSDPRESVALLEAVEPVSELVRVFGRSLGSPVRPIAVNAGEAVTGFLKDLNPPDSPMRMSVPGLPEMMSRPMAPSPDRSPSS